MKENAEDITKSSWGNNSDVPYNGAFKVTSVNTKDEVLLEKMMNIMMLKMLL